MPGYKNRIKAPLFIEHTIVDSKDKPIGTIRIKPSSILWKPKGKGKYYAVSIEDFRDWISNSQTKAKLVKS